MKSVDGSPFYYRSSENGFMIRTASSESSEEEDGSQGARINTISSKSLVKRKKAKGEMEELSLTENRRITPTSMSNKRKATNNLTTNLTRSRDEREEKKRKTMEQTAECSALFSEIGGLQDKELENRVLVQVHYANQQGTIDKLIEKTFEYPQTNGQAPSYFQITGDHNALNTLRLSRAEPTQNPKEIIRLEAAIHKEKYGNESKEVEKQLFEKFEEIVEEVKKQGYWKLPLQIQQEIPFPFLTICSFSQSPIGRKEEVEQNIALFSRDRDLLERFCTLKIKEICSYINNEERKSPSSSVWLSILREQGKEVSVTEVEILFEDGLAVMPLSPMKKNTLPLSKLLLALLGWIRRVNGRLFAFPTTTWRIILRLRSIANKSIMDCYQVKLVGGVW